jgi:hypothetical protein
VVRMPCVGSVTVTCTGEGGCLPKQTFAYAGGTVQFWKVVRGQRFRPGDRLVITIAVPSAIALVETISFRHGTAATSSERCLAPGEHVQVTCSD